MSIILFHKPYGVLSQFQANHEVVSLADFISNQGYYPAGRLDKNSEGLLVLTNNGVMQHKISHPNQKMSKTYWVQVEGIPDSKAIEKLTKGILLKGATTLPAQCKAIKQPYLLNPRNPPIRTRKHIPDSWLALTICEGRNHQVRRMCAAVGYPVLRLIRYRVGSWTLDGLAQGDIRLIE